MVSDWLNWKPGSSVTLCNTLGKDDGSLSFSGIVELKGSFSVSSRLVICFFEREEREILERVASAWALSGGKFPLVSLLIESRREDSAEF